ncbi:tyrosine-type recombinase/integrase [Bengtsoniella intestinalis]|uniref:tyrosine-type recombinase/integrase n=1 Tax=Bengtsoniella intestinalis TaxID=3073143 RepID=UPI00391EED1F
MSAIYKYEELYEELQKQRYMEFVGVVSSNSIFTDDVWICDKRNVSLGNELHKIRIHFANISQFHRECAKFFAVLRLIDGIGVRAVKIDLYNLGVFLKFLGVNSLSKVDYHTASQYKIFLDQRGYVDSTKSRMWSTLNMFFRKMNGFDNLQYKNPFTKNIYQYDKLIDSKYIPEDVAKKLDSIFMNEEISVTYRCIYWVLRLIPSRISEVLGMEIECVKPFDGHFVITIPTWKQNGGYLEPIKRLIHVEDTGMGGHLLSLIREQQEISQNSQAYLAENKKNALFTYQDSLKLKSGTYKRDRYIVATWSSTNYHLKKICKQYDVTDSDGRLYNISSHQFRHNGVTDRLRAGFTLPQIAEMTAHHGTAMLYGSYAHLNLFPETLIEPVKYDIEEENSYVLFGGRILNMDAITESRLLKNLRSHRIPGGICADVTHCKSGMWDCISCEKFIPEQEQLEYFKEQVKSWSDKATKFKTDDQLHNNFLKLSNQFADIIKKLEDLKPYEY